MLKRPKLQSQKNMGSHLSFCRLLLLNNKRPKGICFVSTITVKTEIKSNPALFSDLLRTCLIRKSISLGKKIHSLAITSGSLNRFVSNQILNMYSKLGEFQDAVKLFDHIPSRNTMSCNIMINAYVNNGDPETARKLFAEMTDRNIATWNAMISGSVRFELNEYGLELFSEMLQSGLNPDEFGFASVLRGCAGLRALAFGKQVHCCAVKHGFETDLVVSSSLSHMYMKCSNFEEGERVINSLPTRNVVAWNTLLAGKAQSGRAGEVLDNYRVMRLGGFIPDDITLVTIITSCAELAKLGNGRKVHAEAVKVGACSVVSVMTALVDMYSKCGCLEESEKAFRESDSVDPVLWSSMISAYGLHGRGNEAIRLFEKMDRQGLITEENDGVAFLSLLYACSHCGMREKGVEFFDLMVSKYGLRPRLEHYNCLVDMLARLGHFERAESVIRTMPFKPDAVIWKTFLSACKTHKDAEMATRVAGEILKLDETPDSALYVLLSNIYASAEQWDKVSEVREAMREKNLGRERGSSWFEMKHKVQ